MPLYEYQCASCGDIFEVIQKFSDEPLHEHPGCGGPVKRLISPPALQFKGSGWYVTDYGRNGSGERKHQRESSGAKAESKKDDSAKPAAASAKET
jgi:putative FmdB family regulatory protein